jgi:hypothetical protein
MFTRSRHWALILSQMNPVHVLRHYSFKIHVDNYHPIYQVASFLRSVMRNRCSAAHRCATEAI